MKKYQHDCNRCEFITDLTIDGQHYDIYRCPNKIPSWIARFGSDGPDNWPMPWDVLKTVDTTSATKLMKKMQQIAQEYEAKKRG